MDAKLAANAYRESAYQNSPPIKIVHMMYEGALRFLEQAQAIDPEQDPAGFVEKVNRIDAIVCELRLSLDHEQSPELCENLNALYLFIEDQLRQAASEHGPKPLAAAKSVLETLYEGWKGVEVQP